MSTTPPSINNAPDSSEHPVAPNMASGPVAGPDLSSLVSPGASIVQGQPAPNYQTGALGSAQESIEQSNAYNKNAADLASAPIPAASVGSHQKLFSIIQAIGIGLSNAGAAAA